MSDWSKLGSVGKEAVPAWGVELMERVDDHIEFTASQQSRYVEIEARVARLEERFTELAEATLEAFDDHRTDMHEPRGPHD